jgi:hypothetical protein
LRQLAEDGLGFFAGQTGNVGDGVLVEVGVLGDVRWMDLKREAGLGEEFAAAGRGRGEDQHRLIMPWAGGGSQFGCFLFLPGSGVKMPGRLCVRKYLKTIGRNDLPMRRSFCRDWLS